MNICRVYFHSQPITKTFYPYWGFSIHHYHKTTTERVLSRSLRLVKSKIFPDECEALPSGTARGPLLQRCQRLSVARRRCRPVKEDNKAALQWGCVMGLMQKAAEVDWWSFTPTLTPSSCFSRCQRLHAVPGLSTPAFIWQPPLCHRARVVVVAVAYPHGACLRVM